MKKFLIAAAGLVALAAPALAADIVPAPVYTKAPPPPVVGVPQQLDRVLYRRRGWRFLGAAASMSIN